ncbi:alanine racemase [Hyphococcus luteus]|uniref:alanine racemase n=1 Tax=Hyphococcus luteus TaxID=2058213 RepID=UPI0013FDC151
MSRAHKSRRTSSSASPPCSQWARPVTLILDTPETAQGLAAKAKALGQTFNVLIDIDCGAHRGGVPGHGPERLLEIAAV